MSNRQIAVLVLIASVSAIVGTFYFFFIRNVSEIRIGIEWPETANVRIMKGVTNVLAVDCEKECTLSKIPPFDYELVVSAEGYVVHRENVSVRSRDTIYRRIALVKDVKTESYEEDVSERVAELRGKKSIMSEEIAASAWRIYVWHYDGNDYFTESKPAFRLVERDSDGADSVLFASETGEPSVVSSGDWLLWISAEWASSLFDLESGERHFPTLPKGITKIERTFRPGYFVATDSNDAYAFEAGTKSLEKISLYSDFIPRQDGKVIALVKLWDEKRAALLNLWDASKSYVFTDSWAWERKVIYSTEKTVTNLHAYSWAVVLEYDDGEKEVLKNFE